MRILLKGIAVLLATSILYEYWESDYIGGSRWIFRSVILFLACVVFADYATQFRAINVSVAIIGWIGLVVQMSIVLLYY